MKHHKPTLRGIPTNIITGFLGAGKTTLILHLLKQKPADERWAVLVNEFGEIGVDGSIMHNRHPENEGIFIREVPGGCMCCSAGLPMLIALNQLLTRAKPDRLLIEPTGLGHPKEVLEVLSAEHYREVLNIQQCITLVDARKLADSRYTTHATFNQQIDMADIIIGHKDDLYLDKHRQDLKHYVETRLDRPLPIYFIAKGKLDIAILDGASSVVAALSGAALHRHTAPAEPKPGINDEDIPACGFLSVENTGEDYRSIGWRFSAAMIFDRTALFSWLSGLSVERAKGVFITSEGVFGYNLSSDTITEIELDDCIESRMEIIYRGSKTISEKALLNCMKNQGGTDYT